MARIFTNVKPRRLKNLKLAIELVPRTCWDRGELKSPPNDGQCRFCQKEGQVRHHRIWAYDDEHHFRTLMGSFALCDLCAHVKHVGRANVLANAGRLDYDEVVRHFMKVNRCGRNTFAQHKFEAMRTWEERSKYEWTDVMELPRKQDA